MYLYIMYMLVQTVWLGTGYTVIVRYRKDIYVPDRWVLRAQLEIHWQNVDRVLSLFSSRPNWDSPTPSPAGECVLSSYGSGGGYTLTAGEGGVPIQTLGQTLWYSRYLPIYCMHFVFTGMGEGHHTQTICIYVRDPHRSPIFCAFCS